MDTYTECLISIMNAAATYYTNTYPETLDKENYLYWNTELFVIGKFISSTLEQLSSKPFWED